MKICAYVQNAYAKQTYKNECLDARGFVGLRVVIDALNRAGYEVDWAGSATVNRYDIVLVSLTADCDWWSFVQERLTWPKGNYKVLVGGAGVLHVTPFLPFGDFFTLGRGEESLVNLVRRLDGKPVEPDNTVIESATFSPENQYQIRQTEQTYPYTVILDGKGKPYNENEIGCNHKCLFCGYTWHRKFLSPHSDYRMGGGLFAGMEDKERAMLDIQRDPDSVDFSKLRTTAIDGMSERLRYMVNKRISRQMVVDFTRRMIASDVKPHQIKYFNIVGYPTETFDDWLEFKETLEEADNAPRRGDKQWAIVLHNTPFQAMPATPLACAPMAKVNFRGEIAKRLGAGLEGSRIYVGNNIWSVESMGTESLASSMLAAIAFRGEEGDTENIIRLCKTKKFWGADVGTREATLAKYFNMDKLFGEYSPEKLPSRYLRTYCAVEKTWQRPAWKPEFSIKP